MGFKLEKLYLLKNQDRAKFVLFSVFGTYIAQPRCNTCRNLIPPIKTIIKDPLIIEWIKGGSKVIGDFSWHDGGFDIVISNKVKDFLISKNYECNFGKVNIQKPKTKKENKKIITEPDLHSIMPINFFDLNVKKSLLEVKMNCEVCRYTEYKFKMNNLVIDRDIIKDCKLFSLNQFGIASSIYVTEIGLKLILSQNFTNFQYCEAGWIE